jgi:membrane associated rhomboid family serine protease
MFIIVPVGMNYQTERRPVVTLTLMGINIFVYLVCLIFEITQGQEATLWIYEHLWLVPALSSWHTYITDMFVHAGFFHLLGNMVFLFLFGCCVEDIIGRWKFLSIYLVGGLVANFVYIIASPEHFSSETPMGGASGAISTCMGAYLLLRAGVDIDFKYFAFFFFRLFAGEFSLPAWVAITFWFLKDLFFMALSFYLDKGRGGGVAFGAHVGGFLAGLGAAGLLKLVPEKQPEPAPGPMRVHLPMAARPELHTEAPTLFLYDAEVQSGPFNQFQIQQMLAEGSVSLEALYWSEGMTEWRNIAELADRVPGV